MMSLKPPVVPRPSIGGFKLMMEDRGNLGLGELKKASDRVVADGNDTPGLQDLFNSSRVDTPWTRLDIDRTKCQALGVSVGDLFLLMQVNLGSYYVNNFNEFGRTWQVNVQADPNFRAR